MSIVFSSLEVSDRIHRSPMKASDPASKSLVTWLSNLSHLSYIIDSLINSMCSLLIQQVSFLYYLNFITFVKLTSFGVVGPFVLLRCMAMFHVEPRG